MGAMRVRQAIVSALAEEMRADASVIFFGEDVAAAEIAQQVNVLSY